MTEAPPLSSMLEAILFGAGRSMSVDELAKLLAKRNFQISESLDELRNEMEKRENTALQLSEVSGRWIIEVNPSLSPFLPDTFKPEIPQRLLPAAALIAIINQCPRPSWSICLDRRHTIMSGTSPTWG